MSFSLPRYLAPDFAALGLDQAPDVKLAPAEQDGVVPEGYHATTLFPEYWRRTAAWTAWRWPGTAESRSWSSAT